MAATRPRSKPSWTRATDAAKESLIWLATPSSGLLLLGLVAVVALVIVELFAPARARAAS